LCSETLAAKENKSEHWAWPCVYENKGVATKSYGMSSVIESVTYQSRPVRKLLFSVAVILAIIGPSAFGQPNAPPLVESPPAQPLIAQTPKVPEWQAAAGGKMSFDVASVRQDPSGKFRNPGYSFDSDDQYIPNGGLFTTDASLRTYINFAYKLNQMSSRLSGLPKWAATEHFEIRARAAGNPSKDQMRLMMQSLLAERFKLVIHFETQELPVLALTLIKPGKPGPKLRQHADGPACDAPLPPANSTADIDVFPAICNDYLAVNRHGRGILAGARNTTAELMAAFIFNVGHVGRPVVDRTGLSGNIDFMMEYTPELNGPRTTGEDTQPDLQGETFLEAVKDQLGLKLEPTKAALEIPVIDHVEMPSEN
jgi:uncharacterized protein (TIGR03435 family)